MKGFIYNGPGSIELKEIPMETCGDNDVILKNIYAGVCGSDVTAYKSGGDFMRLFPGMEMGHECVSEVVEVGKNVEGIAVGDRVFPYPIFAKDDTKRSGSMGAFSQYIHVPNCKLDHSVYKVDDTISDKVASIIEPFAVGGQAALLSRPKEGQNAIVYGAGVVGMAAAITLKYLGCDKILIANRSTFRLDIAKELGFEVCSPVQEDIKEKAAAYFGPAFGVMGQTFNADIYIDAIGGTSCFELFQQCGKIQATYTLVGLHHDEMKFHPAMFTYSSWTMQGAGGYSDASVRLAMEIMQSGKFDIEKLITQEYPLEELEDAIKKAMTTSESLKVIIKNN
ncbi:MAG: alcohol dehydrogenase catalytic domain-containing protein [Eubacterium sp.]|nr:alcohol dehydrogenase catalytic domain-containing protein [Eubacterium sp.]